jgi:hypothetical protein
MPGVLSTNYGMVQSSKMTFVLILKANLQADFPVPPSYSGLSLAAVRYFLCLLAGFGSEHAHSSEGSVTRYCTCLMHSIDYDIIVDYIQVLVHRLVGLEGAI